jgi:hypothetical protein
VMPPLLVGEGGWQVQGRRYPAGAADTAAALPLMLVQMPLDPGRRYQPSCRIPLGRCPMPATRRRNGRSLAGNMGGSLPARSHALQLREGALQTTAGLAFLPRCPTQTFARWLHSCDPTASPRLMVAAEQCIPFWSHLDGSQTVSASIGSGSGQRVQGKISSCVNLGAISNSCRCC